MFLPNSKYFICAPGKEQGAKIAKEKFDELFQKFPMLKNEYVKYNASNDYVTIVFKNGSVFDVVGALNSTRGGRRNGYSYRIIIFFLLWFYQKLDKINK